MVEGLLSPLLSQLSALGIKLNPQMINNELVIEVTENDVQNAILKDANPQIKNLVKIELHEGKMVIKVKLF